MGGTSRSRIWRKNFPGVKNIYVTVHQAFHRRLASYGVQRLFTDTTTGKSFFLRGVLALSKAIAVSAGLDSAGERVRGIWKRYEVGACERDRDSVDGGLES